MDYNWENVFFKTNNLISALIAINLVWHRNLTHNNQFSYKKCNVDLNIILHKEGKTALLLKNPMSRNEDIFMELFDTLTFYSTCKQTFNKTPREKQFLLRQNLHSMIEVRSVQTGHQSDKLKL